MLRTREILYSYFMPVCSIVKTFTPRCRGRPDALLHEAYEITVLLPNPFDEILKQRSLNGVAVDDAVLLQNGKFHQICSILVSECSARSN